MTAAVARTIADAAAQLAGWGFRVHPLRGKQPLEKSWTSVATSDGRAARDLFASYPHANVGIATGRGLIVLDVDPRSDGHTSLDALLATHGPLPETVTVRTGGGGSHFYLRVPAGIRLRNSSSKLGRGLDIKTDGGQVVAPPSVHPETGAPYTWAPSQSPADVEIAAAPAWLLDLLTPRAAESSPRPAIPAAGDLVTRARRYVAAMDPAIAGAGGHDATFAVAQVLVRGFGLDRSTALAILLDDYNPRCQPPWSEKELVHKIESADTTSTLPVGYLRDTPNARAERPRRPASVTPIRADTAADDALAPLDAGYASLCRILRTPALRVRVLGEGELEFDQQSLFPSIGRQPLRPDDLGRLREKCELVFRDDRNRGLRFKKEQIQDAVVQVARERPYHPVSDWLQTLKWDGVPRIDFVAEDVLGIDTNKQGLATSMLRSWFVSAVARALDPGCKVDTVLILKGPQSAKKSTFFETLAGRDWFTNGSIDIHNPNAVMVMASVWIVEFAELSSLLRAKDSESLKQFITCATDRIRPPYEPAPRTFPRCSVIVGTTNNDDFLRDATGSRRYWPIEVSGKINIDLVADWREQLWAEAVVHYRSGARWWLADDEETRLASSSERFQASDAWEEPIEKYLTDFPKEVVSVARLLGVAIAKPSGQWTRADENRVADILKRLGFAKAGREIGDDGKKRHTWQRVA
jgi:hypothetical protein